MTAGGAAGFFGGGAIFFAQFALSADQTGAGVFEHHQAENITAQFLQLSVVGGDDHTFGDRGAARRWKAAHAFDFDDTESTRPERGQCGMGAQMRNVNAVTQGTFKNGLAVMGGNDCIVESNFHF